MLAKIQIDGSTYCLEHLQPKVYNLILEKTQQHPQTMVKMLVRYSSHCYSVGAGLEEANLRDERHQPRKFCIKRYNYSKYLPFIFSEFIKRDCFFTNHSNFLTIELLDEMGESKEYEIYFRVKLSGDKKVDVYVESSYVRDCAHKLNRHKLRNREKIRARTLIGKVIRNERIKKP